MDTLELLLHPVRVRITHALSGGRTRTTAELCASLPDVSKATVYRHVALLAEAGVLEVAGEQRVRGAVERSYRLRQERAKVARDAAEAMSLEEHRRWFAAAMGALLAEFNAYLDRDGADPAADAVGYTQIPVWLSRDEQAELVDDVVALIKARAGNDPSPDRRPYLLSPIIFPIADHP